jgi:DNA-binding CsgD family transcriptional regulator/pimeloyl-ACP methyl ester carboxylesterase
MSDPIDGPLSIDDLVTDIEAVVTALGVERIAALAVGESGNTVIAYAVKHPDRLSRLVLWCCYARPSDRDSSPGYQATTALVGHDPAIFSETVSRIVLGWSSENEARPLAAGIRAVNPVSLRLFFDTFHNFDVTRLLPNVTAPTLVMHRRGWQNPGLDAARVLTGGIPNARMLVLEGASGLPYAGDMELAAAAVDEHLAPTSTASPGARLTGREATVLGLVAVGKSNLEISAELFLSLRTVERHITHVYRKIGARNRAEATAYAINHRLA